MKSPLLITIPLLALSQVIAYAQATLPGAAAVPQGDVAQITSKLALPRLAAGYGKLPLSFEANQGQANSQVRFVARGQGYSLFLTDSAAVLTLTKGGAPDSKPGKISPFGKSTATEPVKTDVVRMELAGASHSVQVTGGEQLPGTANYFIGNDPAKWHSSVPTYAKVKYAGVYPGVDLVYYGNQRQLEYDFVVAPGAEPGAMRLHFTGQEKLAISADGSLTVSARNGDVAFHKPVVYQMKDGLRLPVEGHFALLAADAVGFALGDYDRSRELIIDPTLEYSTYLGGGGNDVAYAIAVDSGGNAYVTGYTFSTNFPVSPGPDSLQVNPNSNNGAAFVSKLNSAGTALRYSVYLGGTGMCSSGIGGIGNAPANAPTAGDLGNAIAVDASGEAYVAGQACSQDFPVTPGAFQSTNHQASYGNAFVTKLNSTGTALIYSTYLGGSNGYSGDFAQGIAVDSLGYAYVAGQAFSRDFPVTTGAFQTSSHACCNDGFVTKFNPTGTGLVYSTLLGDNFSVGLFGIAIDSSHNAYVVGYVVDCCSEASSYPVTANAFQPHDGGVYPYGDGVVSVLNSTGTALLYSTYLGGSNWENAIGVAIDSSRNAYVTGWTMSSDFPTKGAFQSTRKAPVGTPTAFVTKIDTISGDLVYSTYLSGSTEEQGEAIAVDPNGDAYVTGFTYSPDFPMAGGAYQAMNKAAANQASNAFFTELNPAGNGLLYSTYLGGSGIAAGALGDSGHGIALDSLGNIYVAGTAYSEDFPTSEGSFQGFTKAPSGSSDAFVSEFVFNRATTTSVTSDNNPQASGEDVTFTANVQRVEGSVVPIGVVSFIVDGVIAGHAALDGSGEASFTTNALTVGPHTVVASYLGQETVTAASSGVLTQTITGQVSAPTFNPPGGTFSSPRLVVIETASPGATIYYTTGNTMPTTSSTQYTAPIAVSATTTIHAIAVESGDTQSPVATATFTVLPPAIATTTTLESSLNPSTQGQLVTFTATVTAASGPTPTGSVTFKYGSVILGSAPLVAGTAQFSTSSLTPEGYPVMAVYTGNATDANSHSESIVQIVNQ